MRGFERQTLSKQLMNAIISSIESGELATGEKLPPERQLAEMMQVSRSVVNGGIGELEKKGFLIIKPRSGTYVADAIQQSRKAIHLVEQRTLSDQAGGQR